MSDGTLRWYQSTRDGVTRHAATPGSAADKRFAHSKRWTLIEVEGAGGTAITGEPEALVLIESVAREVTLPQGEPGTFDYAETALLDDDGQPLPNPDYEPDEDEG